MSKAKKIKLLVYLNFVMLLATTVYIVYISLDMLNASKSTVHNGAGKSMDDITVSKVLVYIVVSWTLVFVISTIINLILLQGVIQRNYTKCLVWLIIFALGTIYHVNKIIWSFLQLQYWQGIYLLFWVLLNLYSMYLVKCFMNEMKSDSALQPLTSSKD